ncbi:hypothetical protein H1R20_g7475, partial [Candolleomyces eurysporus]
MPTSSKSQGTRKSKRQRDQAPSAVGPLQEPRQIARKPRKTGNKKAHTNKEKSNNTSLDKQGSGIATGSLKMLLSASPTDKGVPMDVDTSPTVTVEPSQLSSALKAATAYKTKPLVFTTATAGISSVFSHTVAPAEMHLGTRHAQTLTSRDLQNDPLRARVQASSAATASQKSGDIQAMFSQVFMPNPRSFVDEQFKIKSGLHRTTPAQQRATPSSPLGPTMSSNARSGSLVPRKSGRFAAPSCSDHSNRSAAKKASTTTAYRIPRRVHMYSYRLPPLLPPPNVDVPVQIGRSVPSGDGWCASVLGPVIPRPPNFVPTGYKKFTSFRLPKDRQWYQIPPTYFCPAIVGASSPEEVECAWDAARLELRTLRKKHAIPDVPTPDPPSDLDEDDRASVGDHVDGVSTNSGSSFNGSSDSEDDDYNDDQTAQAGKRKRRTLCQEPDTSTSRRACSEHSDNPPTPRPLLPQSKKHRDVRKPNPTSPPRLSAAQKGKGCAPRSPPQPPLQPPPSHHDSNAASPLPHPVLSLPDSVALAGSGLSHNRPLKPSETGIHFSRAGNRYNHFLCHYSQLNERPDSVGCAEFNQNALAIYCAMDKEEKKYMAPVWKQAYEKKYSFSAAVGDSDATVKGKALAGYMRKMSKHVCRLSEEVSKYTNGDVQVVSVITSRNPIARQASTITTADAALTSFITAHEVELADFIDNFANFLFAIGSGLVKPQNITMKEVAECFIAGELPARRDPVQPVQEGSTSTAPAECPSPANLVAPQPDSRTAGAHRSFECVPKCEPEGIDSKVKGKNGKVSPDQARTLVRQFFVRLLCQALHDGTEITELGLEHWTEEERAIPKGNPRYLEIPIVKDANGLVTQTVGTSVAGLKKLVDTTVAQIDDSAFKKPLEKAQFRSHAREVLGNAIIPGGSRPSSSNLVAAASDTIMRLDQALGRLKNTAAKKKIEDLAPQLRDILIYAVVPHPANVLDAVVPHLVAVLIYAVIPHLTNVLIYAVAPHLVNSRTCMAVFHLMATLIRTFAALLVNPCAHVVPPLHVVVHPSVADLGLMTIPVNMTWSTSVVIVFKTPVIEIWTGEMKISKMIMLIILKGIIMAGTIISMKATIGIFAAIIDRVEKGIGGQDPHQLCIWAPIVLPALALCKVFAILALTLH